MTGPMQTLAKAVAVVAIILTCTFIVKTADRTTWPASAVALAENRV